MNSELIELPLQKKKLAKLKTRKGSLGKNKGIIKRKKEKEIKSFSYTPEKEDCWNNRHEIYPVLQG